MKNYIRPPFIAIALALSMVACKGNDSGTAADSTKLADSSSTTKVDSTVKHDTSKNIGIKMDDPDTIKKNDTIKKTTVKTTEVKKSSAKKDQ